MSHPQREDISVTVNRSTGEIKPDELAASRPFADWLREQAKGKSHDELSEGLRDLVQRVQDTGKKGSLTYKVTVEPTKGIEGALTVTDEISLRLPEHERVASLFFADDDGNLVRDDPNQLQFESLREVPRADVQPTTTEKAN